MTVGTFPLPNEVLSTCSDGGFLYCFWLWADQVSSGLFSIFALLFFGFAIYIATVRFGNARAFGFASFVLMVGAFWLATLGFLAWWISSLFIIIGLIGIAVMIINEK